MFKLTSFLALVFLSTVSAIGQIDTTYFNKHWERVENRDSAMYFQTNPIRLADGKFLIKDYYIATGTLQNEAVYKDSLGEIRDGFCIWYFESGNKSEECFFIDGIKNGKFQTFWDDNNKVRRQGNLLNGFLDGEVISYYKNGNVERKEIYEGRDFVSGQCFTVDGRDTAFYKYVDRSLPRFPGGDDNYDSYVVKRRKYPEYCRKNKIQGKVYVYTYFDETGKIYKTQITRKVHPLLDNEALRIINAMPRWEPALSDTGVPEKSERELDIFFEL
jgi:hypothetical protein